MIVGVGIDIIEVERVLEKINRPSGFKEQIFSEGEISYCESQKNKGEHYAGRFAAKEAFLKATGTGLTAGYLLSEIEIISDALGKPSLILTGSLKTLQQQKHWSAIHVSISHLSSVATAVVILEQ